MDATKEESINQNIQDLVFDVIVDDASHKSLDVIKTFQIGSNKTTVGYGLLLIEFKKDFSTAFWVPGADLPE